jgi:pimeloyl-ACP methyl ester carboxylesterase
MIREMAPLSKRNVRLIAGAATALVAGAAIAAERVYVARDRARPDPDADEPFGELRGEVIDGVVSADGTPLHVEQWGSGPTVVLAHGYCLNLRFWHYQIKDLSRDFRVVAYDQRGHGLSGRPRTEGHWVLDALAEDLGAVMTATGPEPAVVIGHSMGGMAALAYARDFPESMGSRIAGLVLADTTAADVMNNVVPGVGRWVQATLQGFEEAALKVAVGNADRIGNTWRRYSNLAYLGVRFLGFGPNPSPSKVAYNERVIAETPPDVLVSLFPAVTGLDVTHILPAVDVPVLVIVGSHDKLTPQGAAQRLAESLKDAELYVVPGAGHNSMFEKPDEFDARVRAFLETIPGWA